MHLKILSFKISLFILSLHFFMQINDDSIRGYAVERYQGMGYLVWDAPHGNADSI